ncbi:CMP-sialic acid transporter 3-like [Hibiscus syriacus]|uniref:CMP-sialic acid transporter 3-like n=1 Tax=Hibiscus syriacus TaxID=106335 RepID=UPI001923E39F|nr:CMP-sialic acid transporter 3-like [Hibiscus syriacus]
MSKANGGFKFSPLSVNLLTEVAKVTFAIIMLLFQVRKKKVEEKSLLSISSLVQAARNNVLLAVPALLYAINNYLKFIMQLYFNPATVKMLSNLKVLVIVIWLKMIMKWRFSILQWEALALLLIGISINQLRSLLEGTTSFDLPVATCAYMYTLIFVTIPSMASVFNEYALKSKFETSIYHQNLFLYGYGAIFNFLAILGTELFKDNQAPYLKTPTPRLQYALQAPISTAPDLQSPSLQPAPALARRLKTRQNSVQSPEENVLVGTPRDDCPSPCLARVGEFLLSVGLSSPASPRELLCSDI